MKIYVVILSYLHDIDWKAISISHLATSEKTKYGGMQEGQEDAPVPDSTSWSKVRTELPCTHFRGTHHQLPLRQHRDGQGQGGGCLADHLYEENSRCGPKGRGKIFRHIFCSYICSKFFKAIIQIFQQALLFKVALGPVKLSLF